MIDSLAAAPAAAGSRFAQIPRGRVVAQEAFGRIEEIGDGVWAMVSTPLEGRLTISNGGIIAGNDGVMIIEGFASIEGAQWMASQTRELTGRRPTHVVLTHYHGDHSGGLAGYRNDDSLPLVLHTSTTKGLLEASLRDGDESGAESPLSTLSDEALIGDADGTLEVDLGGRVVSVEGRAGHTPSDLSVTVEDPRVVFCGDLVWNDMFPNYVDAIPTQLWTSCAELLSDTGALYVPGHGGLGDYEDTRRFLAVIENVGEAATAAFERGLSAVEGAQQYSLPESLGEWFMFSPRYYEVAFSAWHRELAK